MHITGEVSLGAGSGATADHYGRLDGDRQATLSQPENLTTIASHPGKEELSPQDMRRNIIIQGIDPLALKNQQFRTSETILETSLECHPCSRMEETRASADMTPYAAWECHPTGDSM
jgi:MOSC domain-containing protein YiiM